MNYSYDANNNLSSRQESFTYDSLDRLRSYYQGSEIKQVGYDDIQQIICLE